LTRRKHGRGGVNADDLLALLRQRTREAGSAERFAEQHDISAGYVKNVLCGQSKPGPAIALALGLKKVVSFEPVK
jgi:hypothetical protein